MGTQHRPFHHPKDMASAGMKAEDSRPTSVTEVSEINTSNNKLCGLCLQALTIDDQLAGGTTRVNTSDGTSTLDLSGFAHKDWRSYSYEGVREERFFDKRRKEDRDTSGWARVGTTTSTPLLDQVEWMYDF
jgi:hypothetical protein